MNNVLNITSELQMIEHMKKKISTTGFIINKFSENYIVTVHHGLPINRCTTDLYNLKIIKDCIWNELLILKSNTINYDSYNVFKKCKYRIPKNYDMLYIKTNDTIVTLTNASIVHLNLFEIPTNPKIPYIKLDIYSNDVEQSMSGSPVIDGNNYLIGILAKKNDIDKSVYVIPIYILVKSLIKNNNNSIFDINCKENIYKINNVKVNNNLIFHKQLDILIPLSTYFMIEGDISNSIKINNTYYEYININDQLYINNTNKIIVNNRKHEITTRLLKLIKIYFSDIVNDIFRILKENFKNKIFLYINSHRIVTKQSIKEFNTSFDDKDVNLKFIFGEVSSI
jgi:hypothetical protein